MNIRHSNYQTGYATGGRVFYNQYQFFVSVNLPPVSFYIMCRNYTFSKNQALKTTRTKGIGSCMRTNRIILK